MESAKGKIGWKRRAIVYVTTAIFVLGVPSLPHRRLHWFYWLGALAAEIVILAVVVWRRPQAAG